MSGRRLIGRIVYWLAVLVISLAILVALIIFLESRDKSSVSGGTVLPVSPAAERFGR